jgi:hypothetical protein
MNDFDEKYVRNLYKFNKNELKKTSSKKNEVENMRKLSDFNLNFYFYMLYRHLIICRISAPMASKSGGSF